jgi:hypothetical protein
VYWACALAFLMCVPSVLRECLRSPCSPECRPNVCRDVTCAKPCKHGYHALTGTESPKELSSRLFYRLELRYGDFELLGRIHPGSTSQCATLLDTPTLGHSHDRIMFQTLMKP